MTTILKEAKIILRKKKKPMTSKQIYSEVIKRGKLKLNTLTPIASLNSRIYLDIKEKGNKSDFINIKKISNERKIKNYHSLNKKIKFGDI